MPSISFVRKQWGFCFLIVTAGLLGIILPATAQAQTDPGALLHTYAVSGSPLNLAVEAPGRVWFTLPERNAIGLLVVTDAGETVTEFPIPTASSEPYDLVYDSSNGAIWFTERAGNKIGRLEIATGAIVEFNIPTANSAPTGIDIAPDGRIWFTEQNANKLARLNPATGAFSEFLYTVADTPSEENSQLEDVAVENNNSIWFTAPNTSELVQFELDTLTFFKTLPGPSARPFQVAFDANGLPWVTDAANNRIGFYSAGTVVNWNWFAAEVEGPIVPTGIATSNLGGTRSIWFTGNAAGVAGRLRRDGASRQPALFGLAPDSQPWGIAVDDAGSVWIAQRGTNFIARWVAPYFRFLYMPVVFN